jgi:4-carboxymuconolactone decarboxylase
MMTADSPSGATVLELDGEAVALVRLAAAVAGGSEPAMRSAVALAVARVRPVWAEEAILQSYLFAGFPRALNAMREWRRASGRAAPESDEGSVFALAANWERRGEETCAIVYGASYQPLRANIRALHPSLDAWMIVEGYGKVLSRPELPLQHRELCIVAACAASGQERQLHSHLHGALHAGASIQMVRDVLIAVADYAGPDDRERYLALLDRVGESHVH